MLSLLSGASCFVAAQLLFCVQSHRVVVVLAAVPSCSRRSCYLWCAAKPKRSRSLSPPPPVPPVLPLWVRWHVCFAGDSFRGYDLNTLIVSTWVVYGFAAGAPVLVWLVLNQMDTPVALVQARRNEGMTYFETFFALTEIAGASERRWGRN